MPGLALLRVYMNTYRVNMNTYRVNMNTYRVYMNTYRVEDFRASLSGGRAQDCG